MFRIFYELHNDDQLDFGSGTPLPEVKAQIVTQPDGEYNPYIEYEVLEA